jgi:type IV secretion system protein TrbL
MRRNAVALVATLALAGVAGGALAVAPPARASLLGDGCSLLGTIGEGWMGKACSFVTGAGGKLVSGGKKVAGVVGKLAGNPLLQRGLGIAAIVAWVLGGAKWTIGHIGTAISHSTSPMLTGSWFTGVYLRIEALALLFTLLFLLAAGAEAVLRSELALLARAVLVQLPLAALMTALAVPVTMLLLAATDRMSAGISTLAGSGATHFMTGGSAWVAAGLTAADPFFAVLAAGLVVAAGAALWVELLIREVAVYVVAAMLPIAFAALVWPARRVWAIRAIEVLVALILSKVAIVAVLALGGAALSHAGIGSISRLLGGLALILLGAFTPWLLLRLIPLAELASVSVGHIRGHLHGSAGMRTPEAALAGTAAAHVGGRVNGSGSNGAAGGVAVAEVLEQMQRRAAAANGNGSDGPVPGDQASVEGNGGGAPVNGGGPSVLTGEGGSGRPTTVTPRASGSEGGAGRAAADGEQTLAQRPSGSSTPVARTETNAPIPPPAWAGEDAGPVDDRPDRSSVGEEPRPAPPPDPLEPPLGGGDGGEP